MYSDPAARNRIRLPLATAILIAVALGGARTSIAADEVSAGSSDGRLPEGLVDRASAATTRADAYLRARADAIDPAVPLTLDYLARRFDLPPFDALVAVTRRAAEADSDLAQLLPLLGDPAPAAAGPASASRYQAVLQASIACRTLDASARADVLGDARHAIRRGGYEAMHAAVAVGWLDELGCVDRAASEAVRAEAVQVLEGIATAGPVAEEPALEALAVLTYLDPEAGIDDSAVGAIVDAQRPDGSWGRAGDSPHDIDHATMLALWVLLEAARSDAANVPMVAAAGAPGSRPVSAEPDPAPGSADPPSTGRAGRGPGCACS